MRKWILVSSALALDFLPASTPSVFFCLGSRQRARSGHQRSDGDGDETSESAVENTEVPLPEDAASEDDGSVTSDGTGAPRRRIIDNDSDTPSSADDDDDGEKRLVSKKMQEVSLLEKQKNPEDAKVQDAKASHLITHEFMKRFSRNMRLAVLSDSKGDMDEAKRKRLMEKIKEENANDSEQAPPERNEDEEEAPPQRTHRLRKASHRRHRAEEDQDVDRDDSENIAEAAPRKIRLLNAPPSEDDAPSAAVDRESRSAFTQKQDLPATQDSEDLENIPEGTVDLNRRQINPASIPSGLHLSHTSFVKLMRKCEDNDCLRRLTALRERSKREEKRAAKKKHVRRPATTRERRITSEEDVEQSNDADQGSSRLKNSDDASSRRSASNSNMRHQLKNNDEENDDEAPHAIHLLNSGNVQEEEGEGEENVEEEGGPTASISTTGDRVQRAHILRSGEEEEDYILRMKKKREQKLHGSESDNSMMDPSKPLDMMLAFLKTFAASVKMFLV